MGVDALIFGARGQDGRLLSRHLIDSGLSCIGVSRKAGLVPLGAKLELKCVNVDYMCLDSMIRLFKIHNPSLVFNFAGASSVGESFTAPINSQLSYIHPLTTILEAARYVNFLGRIFIATSGDIYGVNEAAVEKNPLSPQSPYAMSRAYGFGLSEMYRNIFGLSVTVGVLFPHESKLRPESFFFPKLINSLKRMKDGSKKNLRFGNVNVIRDFGWAPEYVEGFFRAAQHREPKTYVFGTGVGVKLADLIEFSAAKMDIDPSSIVFDDASLSRPADLSISVGNPMQAFNDLGWKPKYDWRSIVEFYMDEY